MNNFDTRGRAIAHAFWTEMEKISYSQTARMLADAANRTSQDHARLAKAVGWRKWIPFTEAHRAVDAARTRARKFHRGARAVIRDERNAAYRAIRRGKGNQEAALRLIEGKPRVSSGNITVPDTSKNSGGSSTLRRVAIGTTVGLGIAGAGIGGKRLYDINKNRKSGYDSSVGGSGGSGGYPGY